MDFKEGARALMDRHILDWESNLQCMPIGYDYEWTYVGMIKKMGHGDM